MAGYIKLHRKIWNSAIYSDPTMLKLWIHCLMKATYTEHEQLVGTQLIILKPGDFVTGRNALADEFNKDVIPSNRVNPLSLWRRLKTLENMEMLNIKTTNKYSVISIVKWSEYQQDEQQVNNKRTTDEQQMNTNKKGNKVKNEKEDNTPYQEIVDYLNLKTKKSYKHTTKANRVFMKARSDEGATLEDFKKVIDNKTPQWLGDPKNDKYLRPATLFGTKFESYLNERFTQPIKQPFKPKREDFDLSD